jgi:hypothetical protein
MPKKIAFIKTGNFSFINESVKMLLGEKFPKNRVEKLLEGL